MCVVASVTQRVKIFTAVVNKEKRTLDHTPAAENLRDNPSAMETTLDHTHVTIKANRKSYF